MNADPFFSVVIATYNRGKAILPTLQSVLAQSEQDFEVLVVGDACTDDTGDIVAAFGSLKVHWRNLSENGGSQSSPNNAGIRAARGQWIAYLGHDDIWSGDHLEKVRKTIESAASLDVAVSGCIYYGPEETGPLTVTGFLDAAHRAADHFIPPSSMAHRKTLVERIGYWGAPQETSYPVDSDFVLRAANGGAKFAATGKVTVHKFAAGHRYLSYLSNDDGEQRRIVSLSAKELCDRSEQLLAHAKRAGRFMVSPHVNRDDYAAGELFQMNRSNKGLSRPQLSALGAERTIEQTGEPRALDWYRLEEGPPKFRVSGPNPRPRILIPFTGKDAEVWLEIVRMPDYLQEKDIGVYAGGEPLLTRFHESGDGRRWLRCFVRLSRDRYTILSLFIPPPTEGRSDDLNWYRYGIGIASIRIVRSNSLGRLRHSLASKSNWKSR